MKHLRIFCATLALALAAQSLSAEPKDEKMVPAPSTLTDEAIKVIKAAFPNATIGDAKLNMDRGIEAWFVQLSGDKGVSSVEVSAGSAQITAPVMVMQSSLKLGHNDLPDAVAKVADNTAGLLHDPMDSAVKPDDARNAAEQGVKFLSAEKLDIRCEFLPKKYDSEGGNYKLVPLAAPVTAYEVTYVNNAGFKGVVRIAPDGTVINPMNWMKRASAVVPPGKLVIRANLGCVADYTDESGVVWSADRMYKAGGGWGGLGGEPHGGRQHTRMGLVIQGTDAPFIYDSERDKEGQFQFDVPNGLYTVRIHFCETWEGGKNKGSRPFAIDIQGKTVVPSMEIAQEAGGWMKPLVKEFKDIQVTDGKLLITPHGNFNGNDKHASIEAYEIIQQ